MAVLGLGSRPLRAALCWQLTATAIIASIAGLLGDVHAAASAALGGAVVIIAEAAYAWVASLGAPRSAGATIRILLRAEAVKVALIVLELWLVFTAYRDVVALPLIGAFIVAVLLWPVALLYRD